MISEVKRPNCQSPAACAAKGKGHCRKCHMAATVRKLHADPEFAAARKAAQRGGVAVPPEMKADWRTLKKAGYSAAEAAKALGLKPS